MRVALFQPPPPRNSFHRLPDPLPSILLGFLDSRSRKRLAFAVPTIAGFRQALRVSIPPDAARRDPLLQQLASSKDARFSRFAMVDTSQLTEVEAIACQVQDLKFTTSEYQWQRHETFDVTKWPPLQLKFRHLVRLKIQADDRVDVIDLHALSQSLPKLQKLSIRDCAHVVETLRPLPDLHTLSLINTSINSFKIAVGLPKLSCLRLLAKLSFGYLTDVASLEAEVAPLRELKSSHWDSRPTEAFRRHGSTLEKLIVFSRGQMMWYILPSIGSFSALKSLDADSFEFFHLQPLIELASLEELTLKMHARATSCQPLQQLKKLRKLTITRGWLRDIIGMMSSLQQLKAIDGCTDGVRERAVLATPRGAHQNSGQSDLRELSLDGNFDIHVDPSLMHHLQRIEMVKIDWINDAMHKMQLIQQLPGLKRVFIRLPYNRDLVRNTPLTSVSCLEEVSVPQWTDPSIPKWLRNATKLRKLHLDSKTTSITNCPPNLTHLYASMVEDAKIVDKICAQRLVHLRVVSIPREADCLVLRRERREGGALPVLQCILHPTVDCLSVSSSSTEPHGYC